MQQTNSMDRRTEKRVSVGLPVVELEGEDRYFQYATNVSAGGMFLMGPLPTQPGTQVTLVFKLPGDATTLAVPAEVVGNRAGDERGTHFRFIDAADSEARTHIRDYVARH